MKITWLSFLVVLPLLLQGQNGWKDVYSEGNWVQRDSWQKPDTIIAMLRLTAESHVADIGAHEGYFTMKLADKVPRGIVHAVDISKQKLDRLNYIASERGLINVRPILANETDPNIPSLIDAALMVDTYHEIKQPDVFLKNLKTALKDDARLVLCEPIAEHRKGKSRKEQFAKHELESSYAVNDLKKAGFEILFLAENFIDRRKEKGDKMWIIVAKKNISGGN